MTARPMAEPAAAAPARRARSVVLELLLNVVLPYAGYLWLRHLGQSQFRALALSTLIPVFVALASLIYRRRMNMLSLLVIVTAGLSLCGTMLSGSAWFLLVRPSLVTGGLALAFIASLGLQRPALFYLARDTMCSTAEAAGRFEARWAEPGFRRFMRRLTIIWAAFLGGEALLRCVLVGLWPDPTLVAISQVAWVVLPVLLVNWSIRSGRRAAAAAGR